jgi:hypothetical protein
MSVVKVALAVLLVSPQNCDAHLHGEIDLQSAREGRQLAAAFPVVG